MSGYPRGAASPPSSAPATERDPVTFVDDDRASPERQGPRTETVGPGGLAAEASLGPAGRYRLGACLGRGGMGAVYQATDTTLHRAVAIKVLHVAGPSSLAQVLREGRALARLEHENVVRAFDVQEEAGHPFIVMELVVGASLRAWQRAPGRTVEEILRAYRGAACGLAAAHAAGLLHRDFKPDNVLMGPDGKARVTDFGLARSIARGPGGAEGPESGWGVAGTPPYMSPEQLRGERLERASDQFSFCVALYEAFTGARPFPGRTFDEVQRAMAHRAPQLPRSNPAVSPTLWAAIERGLAEEPMQRHASMDDLVRILDRELHTDAEAVYRSNLVVQAVALLMHALVVGVLVIALVRPSTGYDSTDDPDMWQAKIAGNWFIALIFSGWGPIGIVLCCLNLVGLQQRTRWALYTCMAHALYSLPTGIATPFAIYTLVTIWPEIRRRDRVR